MGVGSEPPQKLGAGTPQFLGILGQRCTFGRICLIFGVTSAPLYYPPPRGSGGRTGAHVLRAATPSTPSVKEYPTAQRYNRLRCLCFCNWLYTWIRIAYIWENCAKTGRQNFVKFCMRLGGTRLYNICENWRKLSEGFRGRGWEEKSLAPYISKNVGRGAPKIFGLGELGPAYISVKLHHPAVKDGGVRNFRRKS